MLNQRRSSQLGLSLIEVMIAAAIFTVILIASYLLYERGQRIYLRSDTVAEQQQNTRFAFDRMVITLRKAGANVNPAGDRTLTDEQVEGAWESAIVVRGDFDQSRETALESAGATSHEIVTTANDEIVGYYLGKPGGANAQNISVIADFSAPRNATLSSATPPAPLNEETKTVATAATTVAQQTDPPYTLYQLSWDAAGNAVSTPVAENIFRLRFRYFNFQNALVDPATLVETDVNRANREGIRRIEVQLIGMAGRPDFDFNDTVTPSAAVAGPPDPLAARPFRKFILTEQISSLSLGRKGRDHGPYPTLNLSPPPELKVCNGHCNRFVVTWPAISGVSSYQVHVTAAAAGAFPAIDERFDVLGTTLYVYPANAVQSYSFEVRAWEPQYDAFSLYGPSLTGQTVNNANTPSQVTPAPTATQDGTNNAIALQWVRPQFNTTPLVNTCNSVVLGPNSTSIPNPKEIELLDLANFDVHRVVESVGAAFTPSAANRVDTHPNNVLPGESTGFIDRSAAPCQPYFYRVVARDACDVVSTPSDPMAAAFQYLPAAPVTPSAPASLGSVAPPVVAPGAGGVGVYQHTLTWPAVTTATDLTPIGVSHYVIERYRELGGVGGYAPDPAFGGGDGLQDVYDVLTYDDEAPVLDPLTGFGVRYRYRVYAQFDCAGLIVSGPSPDYAVPCPTLGSASITIPLSGAIIDEGDVQPITVTTVGTWNRADVFIRNSAGTIVRTLSSAATVTSTPYNFGWDTTGMPDDAYLIQAVLFQGACAYPTNAVSVTVESFSTCITFVSAAGPPSGPVAERIDLNGNPSNLHVIFKLRNNCSVGVSIMGFTPSWTGGSAGNFIDQIDYITNTNIFVPNDPDCPGFPTTGASGERMLFDEPNCPFLINLGPGAVSGFFELRFDKNTLGTTFPSFLVHHDQNPDPGDEVGSFGLQ